MTTNRKFSESDHKPESNGFAIVLCGSMFIAIIGMMFLLSIDKHEMAKKNTYIKVMERALIIKTQDLKKCDYAYKINEAHLKNYQFIVK